MLTADNKKIHFFVKKNQEIKKHGLFNSVNFIIDFLKNEKFKVEINFIDDFNEIDDILLKSNPDIIIFESIWVPPPKLIQLLCRKENINKKWIVRIHAKAPFIANESFSTKWIKKYSYIPNLIIAPNSEDLTNQLKSCFPHGNFLFLPNIYIEKEIQNKTETQKDKNYIEIGCFGAIRPLKNHYAQALAAIEFADSINKKLKFHINSTLIEHQGENVLKNLEELFSNNKHELVKHPWYSHDDFMNIISNIDIGMQVSLSESFNIVTADLITSKVPVVVSEEIYWMPKFQRTSPTSHADIVNKLRLIYKFSFLFKILQSLSLQYYCNNAKKTWLKQMNCT
jgi:hypothetical protein